MGADRLEINARRGSHLACLFGKRNFLPASPFPTPRLPYFTRYSSDGTEKDMTPKKIRGAACTLAQFAARYGMKEDEAAAIYEKFGPSSVDLEILMRAKGREPVAAMAD